MKKDLEGLKPCAHCGWSAHFDIIFTIMRIQCMNKKCRVAVLGFAGDTRKVIVRRWNRRVAKVK